MPWLCQGFCPVLEGWANKGWARPVAAATVIPAPQVDPAIIGPKAPVAGLVSLSLNPIVNYGIARDTASLGAGRGRQYSQGRGEIL